MVTSKNRTYNQTLSYRVRWGGSKCTVNESACQIGGRFEKEGQGK